jgi:hypothetical protein
MLKLPSSRSGPAGTWTSFALLLLAGELFSINFFVLFGLPVNIRGYDIS